MNVISANITCWRDSFDFHRRASRGEYWWFWMTYVIFLSTANLISNLTATLVMVLFALPTLSATWRRLHDTGRSGSTDTVKALLEAGADTTGPAGRASLAEAVYLGNREMEQLLIEAGAEQSTSAAAARRFRELGRRLGLVDD